MNKIGYFDAGVITPEEIFIAADLVPIRLLGDPTISIDKANEHIPPTHCFWARNLLEQAINGLEDIKGIIATHGCDCTNRQFDIWLECVDIDFMYFLNAPLKRGKNASKFFLDDIKEMILQLEEKFKVKITDEKIRNAIKLMNKIRSILKELSEYRNKMLLKASEFHALVREVQQQEKNEALKMLKNKLEEIKDRKPFSGENLKRVLLTGSIIDDTEFIKHLETLGYQIVADDLCIGARYFWDLVDENDEPIQSLVNYHLSKPISSTKVPSYNRFNFIKDLAEKYDVDGVINIAQKFCEPILYDHPYMNKKFKELEIPYLFIEMEYNRESYNQTSTRFEAFAEII